MGIGSASDPKLHPKKRTLNHYRDRLREITDMAFKGGGHAE